MKYFTALMTLLIICSMAFLYGCGSATSGGGGGGGGAAAAAWTYFGNNNDNRIYYISPTGLNPTGTIELGCYSPYYMTKSTDEAKLYVSTASKEVLVIDTATNTFTVLATLDVSSTTKAMQVSFDGKYLYMGAINDRLYRISLPDGAVTSESVGGTVEAMALGYDDTELRVFLCNGQRIQSRDTEYPFETGGKFDEDIAPYTCFNMIYSFGNIYAPLYNALTGECMILDTDYYVNIITCEGNKLFGAVAIPGTDEVYVSSCNDPGTIYIIDASSGYSEQTFEGTSISSTELYNPDFMAATKDGKYVAVMDPPPPGHQKIGWVDTSTRTIIDYSTIPASVATDNNIVFIYK